MSSPHKFLLGLTALVFLGVAANAAPLVLTLVAPVEAVAPGSNVVVSLLAVNSGESDLSFDPPNSLAGDVRQGNRTWAVELRKPAADGAPIRPGGFAHFDYSFALPYALRGQLVLEIGNGLGNPVFAVITASPEAAGKSPASGAPGLAPEAYSNFSLSAQPAVSLLAQSFIDHFSPNDPVYFVYGPKAPSAKFQFSLKYRLLSFDDDSKNPNDSSLQFGYTQRSLWDVNAHPSAFYDSSYMPSAFYQWLSPFANPSEGSAEVTWLGIATGYQHESNGQGGTLERSMNTLFVQSSVLIGSTNKWHALVAARAFAYIDGVSDNPDVKSYRGYGNWGLTIADGSGPSLAYTGWAGKGFNHPTSQLDLNIPVSVKFLDFQIFLLAQYFDGYGESFRDYQIHSNIVRGGISLVR